ncbi:MAG: MurR/RpiR family transcriptional regulator [Erysipelotrichaceae bacterium]|nr:MurR/RpiR family transcriptional regulator [Erysipelotrichaceae bacterium]
MENPDQYHDHSINRFNLLTSLLSLLNRNDENDTDFVIARYFLRNLSKLKDTSIYKIADDCYVSRSSVQRFIKNIGYESFTQMKHSLDEVLAHEVSFIDYTDHVQYREYISQSISEMIADIVKATSNAGFRKLLQIFNSADNVVILTAEDSSHACRLFQQQILTTGKLIRIISSASKNISLLDTLTENDLLLVCSVTGNFALAINDQLDSIKARKCLITLNRTTAFEGIYSFIYYLGEDQKISTRNIVTDRNVYNNYGLTFFFDLFYHECYINWRKNK